MVLVVFTTPDPVKIPAAIVKVPAEGKVIFVVEAEGAEKTGPDGKAPSCIEVPLMFLCWPLQWQCFLHNEWD